MTTVFDASFSQLDYETQKNSCGILYFTQNQIIGGFQLKLTLKHFKLFFNGDYDGWNGIWQNYYVDIISRLLNLQTTKDEILRLYNVSHGTTPETHKEVINYTIANFVGFKDALKRCSIIDTSHNPGYKVQFIFILSIAANASTNVSAFSQKVGVEFLMV
jgi:hypothetical protein